MDSAELRVCLNEKQVQKVPLSRGEEIYHSTELCGSGKDSRADKEKNLFRARKYAGNAVYAEGRMGTYTQRERRQHQIQGNFKNKIARTEQ